MLATGMYSTCKACKISTQKKKIPVFQKTDLDGMIFAYDYRAGLACVMTSQQIVLRKLDQLHLYDTLWMS